MRLISSRASFIGLLDIWMIPRKGTFSSSVISIAPATASAQRNSARIAVALCGANRPKLKMRRLSENTTNTSMHLKAKPEGLKLSLSGDVVVIQMNE